MLNRFLLIALCALAVLLSAQPTYAGEIDNTVRSIFEERGIERLLIVVFGGVSMLLGYRLFRITAQNTGQLIAKGGHFSIQLSQIGPGVFFALFGSAVLAYALYVAPTASQSGGSISFSGAMASGGVHPANSRDFLIALTTLNNSVTGFAAISDPAQKKLISDMFNQLEPLRRSLVDDALGTPGRYNEWKHLIDMRTIDPAGLGDTLKSDPELNKRFEETDALLNQTQSAPR